MRDMRRLGRAGWQTQTVPALPGHRADHAFARLRAAADHVSELPGHGQHRRDAVRIVSRLRAGRGEAHGQSDVSRRLNHGQTLRVPGQGLQGRMGGPPGNLYVEVGVEQDDRFTREDLIHEVTLSFPQAALGTEVEIPMLDDTVAKIDIPAGIQPAEAVTVRGKGVPKLNGDGRGDLHVLVHVQVPKRLSSKAKKLLKELDDTLQKERSDRRRWLRRGLSKRIVTSSTARGGERAKVRRTRGV